jgi:hypothetical protein
LFDLAEDPGEKSNLASTEKEVSTQLFRSALQDWQKCSASVKFAAEQSELSQETRDALNALGYIN